MMILNFGILNIYISDGANQSSEFINSKHTFLNRFCSINFVAVTFKAKSNSGKNSDDILYVYIGIYMYRLKIRRQYFVENEEHILLLTYKNIFKIHLDKNK